MTSFNEGDVNRAADGKFAAKTTGESDVDALGGDLRDLPVGERFAELDDSELVDVAELGDEFLGEVSDATIKRDENGTLVAMISIDNTVGPFSDSALTRDTVQTWADSDSDSRGATVEEGYVTGTFQVTRNMTARLDENKPIDQLHDALNNEGFGVAHSADDHLVQWADDNDAWSRDESSQPTKIRRIDYDDIELEVDEVTNGETTKVSLVDVGDVTLSHDHDKDGTEFVVASTTRSVAVNPHHDPADVEGALKQQFGASSATPQGNGAYDVNFSTELRYPVVSMDDVHFSLVRDESLTNFNKMIDSGQARQQIDSAVGTYRFYLDSSRTWAKEKWEKVGRGKPFPNEALREAYIDSDAKTFHENVESWAEGYSGISHEYGDDWTSKAFRRQGHEQAKRDNAL